MNLRRDFNLVERIHNLIKLKATGTAENLAKKLNCSRASVYRYISELESLGAPVIYCNQRKSFIYTSSFRLEFVIEA